MKHIEELDNGYRFRFNSDPNTLNDAAQFIDRERLCCPFFGFALEVESEGGDVSLQLTGREGVKEFIQAEIGEFLGEATFAATWDGLSD